MEAALLVGLVVFVAAVVGLPLALMARRSRTGLPIWIPVALLAVALVLLAVSVLLRSWLNATAMACLVVTCAIQIYAIRTGRIRRIR